MSCIIASVTRQSPAAVAGIREGWTLDAINGEMIGDVLDYGFHQTARSLRLELRDESGRSLSVHIKKQEYEPLGLEFSSYLMDDKRRCRNRCVFCFVDQLPGGMRETLYFKDDDMRLSFLQGNYITLTNLSERDIARIKLMRLSPVNISVHAADPDVRAQMLGNQNAARCMDIIREFAGAGIMMNCQIVLCPGINDGAVLSDTLTRLAEYAPQVASISVVPVGLTRYREGLYPLLPVGKNEARGALEIIHTLADKYLVSLGTRLVFASDELYIKAGENLPPAEDYEDFPQLENGVGMMPLFLQEFDDALLRTPRQRLAHREISVATGLSAAPFLHTLAERAKMEYNGLICNIYGVENRFFGPGVDVAGLLTGGDIRMELEGKRLGETLYIPSAMLRSGEEVFLDDMTVAELSDALNVPVVPVQNDGEAFFKMMMGVL